MHLTDFLQEIINVLSEAEKLSLTKIYDILQEEKEEEVENNKETCLKHIHSKLLSFASSNICHKADEEYEKLLLTIRNQRDEIDFLKMQSLEREKYWKTKLENERKIHEDSLKESVTTFSDFEEKMREYEEISVEIKQISAEISA